MKCIEVQRSTYIDFDVDFDVENNDKDTKIKVDDHVRISKCKDIFAKGYTAN